jgi:hypothetical protein
MTLGSTDIFTAPILPIHEHAYVLPKACNRPLSSSPPTHPHPLPPPSAARVRAQTHTERERERVDLRAPCSPGRQLYYLSHAPSRVFVFLFVLGGCGVVWCGVVLLLGGRGTRWLAGQGRKWRAFVCQRGRGTRVGTRCFCAPIASVQLGFRSSSLWLFWRRGVSGIICPG